MRSTGTHHSSTCQELSSRRASQSHPCGILMATAPSCGTPSSEESMSCGYMCGGACSTRSTAASGGQARQPSCTARVLAINLTLNATRPGGLATPQK
ncbi:hypothetical protein M404DRAFT_534983 [Pisolithus tinctorius Marx 270]|uniref:Uncharacterized protein n=1 Tax=Pisolithus tinctorius Marx 270 TaxID=870435 RepID=A0A0C3K6F8_PISTI|nr:hypothetical protein M404DRAFT_534983 [Pisolithus tinctorius Marx 270]